VTPTICRFTDPLPPALYWDASFIVNFAYGAARYLDPCADFLARLDEAPTLSYVSTLALDEAVFVLLQLKIEEDYHPARFWDVYNDNASVIEPYIGDLQALIEGLSLHPRVNLIGVDPGLTFDALAHMRAFHFLPRDAYHLALMRQHGLDSLVTLDADFTAVPDIRIFTCNEKILRQHPQA
jgi:predicted nucleic acid-binding protein